MDKLRERLEGIVAHYERKISDWEEETGREAEHGLISLCLDADGMPISYGNYDDCLNDGHDAGYGDGKWDLATELLRMFEEE